MVVKICERSAWPSLKRAIAGLAGVLVGAGALVSHGQEATSEAERFAVWRQAFLQSYENDPSVAPRVQELKEKLTLNEQSRSGIEAAAEFRQPLRDYLLQTVSASRVERGRSLLVQHATLLEDIERTYRVDREAILAVWGMESRFGEAQHTSNVWRALATSAFLNQRRRAYFENELRMLITIWLAGNLLSEASSFDGGMGQAQFMPSALAVRAVDWDKDGRADIWNSPPDALASIANYLRFAGWQHRQPTFEGPQPLPAEGEPMLGQSYTVGKLRDYGIRSKNDQGLVATVRRPDPLNGDIVLTYKNFDVLRAYNGGSRYALAASMLSEAISGNEFNVGEWRAAPGELSVSDIARLQTLLVRMRYLKGSADGVFGVATWRSMSAFLRANRRPAADYPTRQVLLLAESLCVASDEVRQSQSPEQNMGCAN